MLKLLLGIIVATVGWIFISRKLGPPVAKWLYDRQLARLRADRVKFPNPDLEKKWQQDTMRRSLNHALIALAAITGGGGGCKGGIDPFQPPSYSKVGDGPWTGTFPCRNGGSVTKPVKRPFAGP